jgi:hypothetical protein
MYYRFVTKDDLVNYPHLVNKNGNILLSDNQSIFYEELDRMIEEGWLKRNSDTSLEPSDVFEIHNDVYKKLHENIRTRIKLISIDVDTKKKLQNSDIVLGLTQSGRNPYTFTKDEKLILDICGHIGLFDIYNIKGIYGSLVRDSIDNNKRKEIVSKYSYEQEVLKVLKEDGFKEVLGWETTEELFRFYDSQ